MINAIVNTTVLILLVYPKRKSAGHFEVENYDLDKIQKNEL